MQSPLPERGFVKSAVMFVDVGGRAIGAAIGAGDIWKSS